MAVASSTPESKAVSTKKRNHVVDDDNVDEVEANEISKGKRAKCPGVRVIGNRIYDSENGKTCHQVIFLFCSRENFRKW